MKLKHGDMSVEAQNTDKKPENEHIRAPLTHTFAKYLHTIQMGKQTPYCRESLRLVGEPVLTMLCSRSQRCDPSTSGYWPPVHTEIHVVPNTL